MLHFVQVELVALKVLERLRFSKLTLGIKVFGPDLETIESFFMQALESAVKGRERDCLQRYCEPIFPNWRTWAATKDAMSAFAPLLEKLKAESDG